MIEFELKFQVAASQRAAVEAAVNRGRSQRTRMRARYFDTADGALAASRVVLRLRKEGRAWVQTAKAPGDSLVQRLEHNVELAPMRAADAPQPVLARHDGTPVGERIAAALHQAGLDPASVELLPTYSTDVWRTTRDMRTGDALVELAFDAGEVRAAGRTHPLCELEFELKHGSPAPMLELAQRWCGRYGLWLDTVSKAERGERLARGEMHGPAIKASPPALKDDKGEEPNGHDIFRAVLKSCLAQILPNASEIAAGGHDGNDHSGSGSDIDEHVHQLRVGIRRLRTALREMAELAPMIDPAWEPALVDTFRALGRHRDRAHLRQTLLPQLAEIGAPRFRIGDAEGDGAGADAAAVVAAPAFQRVLIDLLGASLPLADVAAAVVEPVAPRAPAL